MPQPEEASPPKEKLRLFIPIKRETLPRISDKYPFL